MHPPLQRGENIKRLRREANADIVIEDYVAGSDDRVLSVILHREAPNHTFTSGGDALVSVFHSFCELSRDCVPSIHSGDDADISLASSEATGRRGDDVVVGEGAEGGMGSSEDASSHESMMHDVEFDFRILVDTSQVGFLVGKSGSAIKQLMEETGAYMKVLPKAELPGCAWISDEVVLVSGRHREVCDALRIVARKLESHPPRSSNSRRTPMLLAHASIGDASVLSPPSQALYNRLAASTGMMAGTMVETVFRLLAPKLRVGNIIGRNGEHVQRIRSETGAKIKVYDGEDDADDRLVCIYSTEDAASTYCSAQDALVRCSIALTADDASSGQHRIRLLAPQVSIGAVLGKRGVTVMQLRQETGASIRVQPVEAPLAAAAANSHGGGEAGGDEIIRIDGSLQQCVAALRSVATLLRAWQIRRVASSLPRGPLSAVALAPGLFAHPIAMGAAMGGPVLPMSMAINTSVIGAQGSYSLAGQLSPSSATGDWGAGSSILWRYRLTNAQAGAIIGKGGHHVAQIRHYTGARVHLPGEYAGEGLRTLEISGPLDSCQAAHAMINQFLTIGRCPLAMPEHQTGTMMFPSSSVESASEHSPRSRESPHAYAAEFPTF